MTTKESTRERYHITLRGNVEVCKASKYPCPYASRKSFLHFYSKDEAQFHADELNRLVAHMIDYPYNNQDGEIGFRPYEDFVFDERIEDTDEIIDRAYSMLGFENFPESSIPDYDTLYILDKDSKSEIEKEWSRLVYESHSIEDDFLDKYRPTLKKSILQSYDEEVIETGWDEYREETVDRISYLSEDEILKAVEGKEMSYDSPNLRRFDFEYALKRKLVPSSTIRRNGVEKQFILLRLED